MKLTPQKLEGWGYRTVKISCYRALKIVYRAYRREKWVDLRQIKTKMVNGSFYT